MWGVSRLFTCRRELVRGFVVVVHRSGGWVGGLVVWGVWVLFVNSIGCLFVFVLLVSLFFACNFLFVCFFGEFDPGSGRTLAACLTHASRTERPATLVVGTRVANG